MTDLIWRDFPALLMMCRGFEAHLYARVCTKYGFAPIPDSEAWDGKQWEAVKQFAEAELRALADLAAWHATKELKR